MQATAASLCSGFPETNNASNSSPLVWVSTKSSPYLLFVKISTGCMSLYSRLQKENVVYRNDLTFMVIERLWHYHLIRNSISATNVVHNQLYRIKITLFIDTLIGQTKEMVMQPLF